MELQNVSCPYCGESIELLIDGSVSEQEYNEDCSVCCRPIVVTLNEDLYTGEKTVVVKSENE